MKMFLISDNVDTLTGIPGIVMASAMHQVHSCQEYTEVSEMAQVAGIVSELLQMKE